VTNGAAITSYNLYWDAGTSGSSYLSLIGEATDFTGLTHTQTSDVIEGNSYKFKVRAKNIFGWSDFSSVLTIVAAHAPNTMDAVVTSIDSLTGDVQITWTAPDSNGDDITSYTIEIQD
jgi:hypothetical protein